MKRAGASPISSLAPKLLSGPLSGTPVEMLLEHLKSSPPTAVYKDQASRWRRRVFRFLERAFTAVFSKQIYKRIRFKEKLKISGMLLNEEKMSIVITSTCYSGCDGESL
jgi:hypothetical protein